ncbi:MAG: molecular chaperone DnaJ [Actinomycetota bacterium]|jgi:molecular chaperone DnaJ
MNPDWVEKDFYKVLGVDKSASADDIKKTYRKLAKELHPDANPDNAKAEARFKQVSEAYDVLGNDATRREYDEVRQMASSGGGFPGGFPGGFSGGGFPGGGGFSGGINIEDIFGGMGGGMFGGGGGRNRPRRGDDLETRVTVSFADALQGVTAPIRLTGDVQCASCKGSGAAAGTSPRTCGTCRGSGQVARNVGGFGIPQSCSDCRGSGRIIDSPCRDCRGAGIVRDTRTVQVKIPQGVKDGTTIRLSGRGGPGSLGGPAGDLHVRVAVTPHPIFGRKDDNLTVTVPITLAEAALGAEVAVPVVTGGSVKLKVPAGTTHGKTFRIKDRGVTNSKGKKGDLHVTVEIAVPHKLSKHAKEALEAFAAATADDDPRDELLARAAAAPRIDPDGE